MVVFGRDLESKQIYIERICLWLLALSLCGLTLSGQGLVLIATNARYASDILVRVIESRTRQA